MTEEFAQTTQHGPTNPTAPQRTAPGEGYVWAASAFSLLFVLSGLVIGLNMAFSKRVVPCANGTFFPEGTTDFNCYSHPQAGTGSAIAIFAVVLGVIVVLCAVSAVLALRTRTDSS